MISSYTPVGQPVAGCFSAAAGATTVAEPEDSRLIAAARLGDAAAYGLLVRKYQNRLCSSLRHICGSMADAQDAAQEAFLSAYLKLGAYTGASAFYTWLYRIAVNAVISQHRKKKTRSEREQLSSLRDPATKLESERPDEPLLRRERVAQVQQALASLSTEQRTILVLREFDNCDYDQIARVLAVPVGTVRSRLHRARLALREKLEPVTE